MTRFQLVVLRALTLVIGAALVIMLGVVLGQAVDAREDQNRAQVKTEAQAPASVHGQWTVVACRTNECIRVTLNSMPPSNSADAKLTTWGGGLSAITYVWFRVD